MLENEKTIKLPICEKEVKIKRLNGGQLEDAFSIARQQPLYYDKELYFYMYFYGSGGDNIDEARKFYFGLDIDDFTYLKMEVDNINGASPFLETYLGQSKTGRLGKASASSASASTSSSTSSTASDGKKC